MWHFKYCRHWARKKLNRTIDWERLNYLKKRTMISQLFVSSHLKISLRNKEILIFHTIIKLYCVRLIANRFLYLSSDEVTFKVQVKHTSASQVKAVDVLLQLEIPFYLKVLDYNYGTGIKWTSVDESESSFIKFKVKFTHVFLVWTVPHARSSLPSE